MILVTNRLLNQSVMRNGIAYSFLTHGSWLIQILAGEVASTPRRNENMSNQQNKEIGTMAFLDSVAGELSALIPDAKVKKERDRLQVAIYISADTVPEKSRGDLVLADYLAFIASARKGTKFTRMNLPNDIAKQTIFECVAQVAAMSNNGKLPKLS